MEKKRPKRSKAASDWLHERLTRLFFPLMTIEGVLLQKFAHYDPTKEDVDIKGHTRYVAEGCENEAAPHYCPKIPGWMHLRADSEVRNQLTLREVTKMKYHQALAKFQEGLLKKKQVAQLSAKDTRAAMADYKKIYAHYCNLFTEEAVKDKSQTDLIDEMEDMKFPAGQQRREQRAERPAKEAEIAAEEEEDPQEEGKADEDKEEGEIEEDKPSRTPRQEP
jgi:hypothetical protein